LLSAILVLIHNEIDISGKTRKGDDQMAQTRILVVEDEGVVTRDIKNRLKVLGYSCPASASSGTEAIRKIGTFRPDLVLIDIQLKGEMDGINAARQIHDLFDIPIVYLMEDADEETLQDENVIEPFYYILKPCEENSLHISIEKALYQHKMRRVWRLFGSQQIREQA
jgi:CheY-like chemotaxis protein